MKQSKEPIFPTGSRMKYRILSLVPVAVMSALVAAGCGGGSDGGGDPRPWAEEPFSFDVAPTSQTSLRLQAISGEVQVTGAPGATSISITGVRRVQADTPEDATAHLAELKVIVDDSSATEVLVQTVQPQFSAGRNYVVNYTIVLPQNFAVNVASANGDIAVRSLVGDCTIKNSNGRILADAILGNANMALANGEIIASVTLPSGGQIDMQVVNGNIDLDIPQATSAEFVATVAIGTITLTNLSLSPETVTPGSWSGTLGGGDGNISLGVAIGTIVVHGS